MVTGERGVTTVDLRIEKRVHLDGSVHLSHLVRHPWGWAFLGVLRCTHEEAAEYIGWLRFSRPDGHDLEVERVS